MVIREYLSTDCNELVQLFYDTVHAVNIRDYTAAECSAWAPKNTDCAAWNRSFLAHYTLVAVLCGKIVGFGDLDGNYLDRLYVHNAYQRRGIATAITNGLEQFAIDHGTKDITTHASITARSFFEKRGYSCISEQTIARFGEQLTNFVMNKQFT